MSTISIAGLDKADVLIALYNDAKTQGMGMLHFVSGGMTREMAQAEIEESKQYFRPYYFDYVKGRVLKCDIKGDELDPFLYDRDNGDGAAARAIETLRRGDIEQ